MYKENDKLYFESHDFEVCVQDLSNIINRRKNDTDIHLVTLYRGGLPLGVRMSNQLDLKLSILDYQRLDGDPNKEVSMMKNAGIVSNETIFLIDDIADEGISIKKSLDFLNKEFPNNPIFVYTMFGSDKRLSNYIYTFEHSGEWVVFIPWEGK
jgi:hypoxanthine-guanine phosphoribosyltransferase